MVVFIGHIPLIVNYLLQVGMFYSIHKSYVKTKSPIRVLLSMFIHKCITYLRACHHTMFLHSGKPPNGTKKNDLFLSTDEQQWRHPI